jgi:hypothetical protein
MLLMERRELVETLSALDALKRRGAWAAFHRGSLDV